MVKKTILNAQRSSFLLELFVSVYGLVKGRLTIGRLLNALWFGIAYYFVKARIRLVIEPVMNIRQKAINTGWYRSKKYHYLPVARPLNDNGSLQISFSDKFQAARRMNIRQFSDCFLWMDLAHGLVFYNGEIIKDSFHEPWYKGSHIIVSDYYKAIARLFIYEQPAQYLTGENIYVISHWYNYYHWMVETLYRLAYVYNTNKSFTIILPESLKEAEFVQETLKAYPGVKVLYVGQQSRFLKVKNLSLVSCKGDCEDYEPEILQQVRTQILSAHVLTGKLPAKYIYISRGQAPVRKIANEKEVETLLAGYGFEIVFFEKMSFAEQVDTALNASVVVGIHGAGLTNMLFCKPGTKILELHRKQVNANELHSKVYWKMASSLQHDYYFQECVPVNPSEDFYKADIVVDMVKLEENLKMMLQQSN